MNKSFKLCITGVILFLIPALFFSSCKTAPELTVDGLKCEYLTHPTGIDVEHPGFTWKILSKQRGITQKAYRIIAGRKLSDLKNKTGTHWDSGKTLSGETANIPYEGAALKSNENYYWRVCVWTDDEHYFWSEPAGFHTGLMKNSDWKAKWITTAEEIIHASPLLRKSFRAEKEIKSAYAFVTAGGIYEFYLNGKKVGDHVLDPAITNYRKTVLYSTYDVTRMLKTGVNIAGAMLGNGAYNGRKAKDRYSWGGENKSLGNPCFLAQINITYSDGSHAVIATDETWKYTGGPVTFNNFYGGEDYDARKEIDNWMAAEFDAGEWKNAVIARTPGGVLKSQLMPPIRVTATLQPMAQTNPSPGVYLFDLGQNIAGWWRIKVKGKAGQTIRIRGAETLNDSLFAKPLEKGDVLSTKFNYHAQVWSDYTLRGKEQEVYEPRFFYSGFRYIEVATSDKNNLENLKVEGRVVRSALERTGTFTCSDTLLNRIHQAALWSIKANTISYPTDCPHREKGAYNGDGQVIAETSMHDFDIAAFYTNWLNDMRDSQEENGRIPNTSPTLVGGMGGGVAWGSAYILLPWWMYHYFNDTRVLKEHYPTMKKYLRYLRNLGTTDKNPDERYIINDFDSYWYSLGEWCAPGQSDGPNHPVVNTFYYYYNTLLMSKIAKLLGEEKDARYFAGLSDTIKAAFNKKFFNPETGLYGTENTYQTYQLLALVGDLVPEEYREKVFQTITEDIKDRDGHLNTGIIGTKYLWPVLVERGYNDLAGKIATQTTYPGYGYWLENNATTLLEEWSGRNSHNHQMFGSVVEYFYKFIGGIQSPMEGHTSIGYRHIHLQPEIPAKLASARASVETIAGEIVSEWKKDETSFEYDVTIPANTTATVVLPAFNDKNVTVNESGMEIWNGGKKRGSVPGIDTVKKAKGRIVISIRSGEYHFKATAKD